MNHRLLEKKTMNENLRSNLSELKLQEECGPYVIQVQRHAEKKASPAFFQRRRKFARKCYNMAQEISLDAEVAEVAIWMMDELAMEVDTSLLSAESQLRYHSQGIAAFAIAAKAAGGHSRLQKANFSEYWRHDFSSLEELEQAELGLLIMLDFEIQPPTASAFARTLLRLLPAAMLQTTHYEAASEEKPMFEQAMELVQLQIQLSLTDSAFDYHWSSSPSRIAQAALQNAMQSLLPQNRYLYMQLFFAKALNGSPESNPDEKQTLDSLQAKLSQRLMQHIVAEHELKMMEEEENYFAELEELEEEISLPPIPPTICFPRGGPGERQLSLLSAGSSGRSLLSM